jgi:hypothetical protein
MVLIGCRSISIAGQAISRWQTEISSDSGGAFAPCASTPASHRSNSPSVPTTRRWWRKIDEPEEGLADGMRFTPARRDRK